MALEMKFFFFSGHALNEGLWDVSENVLHIYGYSNQYAQMKVFFP